MWSYQLVTSDLNCVPGLFCPCEIVVVFEIYSLIGSLVIMHDCEAHALMGTFAHASQFKYRRFRHQTGLHTVQKWFACVLTAHIICLHV